MATINVPFLVKKPAAEGKLPRWFWEPSPKLRAEGYRTQRVPNDWHLYADTFALEAAAIAMAKIINDQVMAERQTRALSAASAHGVRGAIPDRSVKAAIKLYKASDEYKVLAATTKRGYDQCLDKIDTWSGDVPALAIDTKRVQNFKKGMKATPAFANATIRVLRLLLAFIIREEGWIVSNPAASPRLFHIAASGMIWPRAAVAAFVAQADAMRRHSIGTAVMLDEWIGQRQGDLLRMPRSAWRDGAITLRQHKTGVGVSLPVDLCLGLAERLRAENARTAERKVAATTIIVDEKTGMAYKADDFRHAFAEVRAGLAQTHPTFELDHLMPGRDMDAADLFTVETRKLQFMHLRHTAITRLGESGVEDAGISAISGHTQASIKQILERYLVRTRASAGRAFQLRLDAEAATEKKARSDGGDAG